ncbi:MAG: glycosyltransferase [Clostridiales bacterium]|nr:glycosyltransferase [Clostridiales bacterium]
MIYNEEKLTEKLNEFTLNKQAYQITRDKKGALNAQYLTEGKIKLLHSAYDAEREGRDFAERKYAAGFDIAVFGMGLGYHIKALAEKMEEGKTLYVFETNLNIIKLAIDFTDIGAVLKRDNVVFYWAQSFALLQSKFYECACGGALLAMYSPALLTVPSDYALLTNLAKTWKFIKGYKIKSCDIQEIKSYFNVKPVSRGKRYSVTVICNEHFHQIVDSSAKNFLLAFSCIGCETNCISLSELDAELNEKTAEMLKNSDFYVSFHPSTIGRKTSGVLTSPLFTIGMDRPYVVNTREITHEKGVICTWHDRNDLRFAGMYHTGSIHKFLTVPAEIDFELGDIFNKKRDFGVVIINNISRGFDLFNILNSKKSEKIRGISEVILSNFTEAKGAKLLEECCKDILGENTPGDLLIPLTMDIGFGIDLQVRYEKRYSVVKALLEEGIELHLFGMDWNLTDAANYPNCVYYGNIEADTGRKFMENCKILVNSMPSWGMDAGHDRILSAMIRGALCITDPTPYLREEFAENEEIVFYDPNNLSTLTEKVNYYLNNEAERLRIAKNGYEKVKARHTFINRAEEIIDLFEEFEYGRNG